MANDQQFCLRWNNHQSTLISVFDSLLENGTLVDCTLAAEGQYLKAHKVVLSACSPYLETLLSQHYEKHPIVILKDVKFSELKSMMDYMYRGEVNISQDQLGTFLKAAESLQIKGLSDNGDDARDVGSTAKKSDAPRPSVTQTRAPIESKRPAPVGDMSDTSRDGSISPSSLRKRRRTRRPSQGDDPDSNLDNNVCDLPAAQSTPMPVPSAAPVQSLPKQIVKTEPPPPMPEPVKKEILDPPAEPLLEPKTEYLDYMNNENSIEVEDLTLDDDDEEGMDSSMDASRPGPSHGDLSQQGGYPPWTMTGDQSGTDEIFMAAQEAVGAATGQQQRDSQERDMNMDNGIEDSPDRSSSPTPFLGFSPPREIKVKKVISKVPVSPRARVSQPRTSKSRASLVWQKNGQKTTTVKEEPADEVPHIMKPVTKDKSNISNLTKHKAVKMEKTADKDISKTSKVEKGKNVKASIEKGNVESDNTDSNSCATTSTGPDVQKRLLSKFKTTSRKGFKCNQCGRVYKYLRGMRQHQKLECNVAPQFPCPYCPNKYRYRQMIREHVRVRHEQAFPKWYATHYVIPLLKQENFSPS